LRRSRAAGSTCFCRITVHSMTAASRAQPPTPKTGFFGSANVSWPVSSTKNIRQCGMYLEPFALGRSQPTVLHRSHAFSLPRADSETARPFARADRPLLVSFAWVADGLPAACAAATSLADPALARRCRPAAIVAVAGVRWPCASRGTCAESGASVGGVNRRCRAGDEGQGVAGFCRLLAAAIGD
jgi:hypothetical protein